MSTEEIATATLIPLETTTPEVDVTTDATITTTTITETTHDNDIPTTTCTTGETAMPDQDVPTLENPSAEQTEPHLPDKDDQREEPISESNSHHHLVPTWVVESESEDEVDENGETKDPFAAFTTTITRGVATKVHRNKAAKKLPLRIHITTILPPSSTLTTSSSTAVIEDEKNEDNYDENAAAVDGLEENARTHPLAAFQRDIFPLSVEEQMAQAEAELEDSLKFFQESHEEQDPAFVTFARAQKQKMADAELKKLELEDQAGRKEIEAIIAEHLKEKQASTDRSVEKYKMKKMAEEKKDMERLQKLFTDKTASNQSKINQGIQVLKKRNSQETQRILQQHRQQVQQRQIPGEVAAQEWASLQQRLQAKHDRQIQEFVAKGEEVKKRTEAEYRKEQAKIREQYEKQLAELDNNRRGVYNKMYAGFQQLRQRYLKRHLQRIMKKKESLENSLRGQGPIVKTKQDTIAPLKDATKEDEVALRPPSPIKTTMEGFKSVSVEKSGAAARHKHRKGMLSQIAKQLSVEIHNEGIWIAILEDKKEEKSKDAPSDPHTASEKNTFHPWGIAARDFLHSIVCGEIPSLLDAKDFNLGDAVSMNGGHIRCVLTDLRTSDETASSQRVEAISEHAIKELESLEKKASESQSVYSNAETMLAKCEKEEKDLVPKAKEALQDYENKKMSWQNFRTKFAKFLGPDGNPVPQTNPSDREKLLQATAKYKGAVETAEKNVKLAQVKLGQLKQQIQKYTLLKKQTQRTAAIAAAALKKRKTMTEGERSANRVKDMVGALSLLADKRRDQLNQKRTSSTSSTWVQNLPGVPGPLRRSLWHKMHRRRQQIVLRPSQEGLALDLKDAVLKSLPNIESLKEMPEKKKAAELEKAEQAFLLAVHPVASKDAELPSMPSTSPWGEPGKCIRLFMWRRLYSRSL